MTQFLLCDSPVYEKITAVNQLGYRASFDLCQQERRFPMRRMTLLLIVSAAATAVFALFTLFTPTAQAEEVGGIIDTDTTWTLAGSPYIITGQPVQIQPGVTLTIEAGVEVRAAPNMVITVDGTLLALGTPTQPITFTSTTETGYQDWDGIGVSGFGTVTLTHSTIRHAYLSVRIYDPTDNPVQIISSTISLNGVGLIIEDRALHRLQMENVHFANNASNRVLIEGDYTSSLMENVTLTDQPGLEGYQITSYNNADQSLQIPAGITLTLKPGVTMMARQNDSIVVDGHLDAQGTITQPITFTSATNTGPGQWHMLIFGGSPASGTGMLRHMVMQYSSYGIGVINHNTDGVTIEDSHIKDNLHWPITVDIDDWFKLNIVNTTFSNNGNNRIMVYVDYPSNSLAADTYVRPHIGIEGYEFFGHIDAEVPEGITLTLEAGTTLMMPEDSRFLVEGHLDAQGTITQPITFTSAANSGPGEWGSLAIGAYGTAVLKHVTVQYANDVGVNNHLATRPVVIENSLFKDNLYYPLETNLVSLSRLSMTNNTFINNGVNRVFIYDWPQNFLAAPTRLTPQPGLEGYELEPSASTLVIPEGITLTLEAGATLMMPQFSHLYVEGRLQANGTAVAPITFTSGENTAPAQWQGIVVDGGEVSLAHAEVRYATTNLTVNSPTSTVTITSSRFISASVNSIAVNDGTLHAACSVITGNGQHGVSVAASGSPSVTITTSEIGGNGVGITNSHHLPVDARFNFWGDPSGPGGVGPGNGNAVYGNVLYDPWLSEPTCTPPPPILPTITISDSTAVESAPFLTFTVTLHITSEQDVLVDYETLDGTAVAHADYLPISGALTIPAGQVTAVLTVPLLNNELADGNRSFTLVLSNPVHGELGNGTAVGLILDDDAPPPTPDGQLYLPVILKP
jgi:hypothetical protein